MDDRLSIIRNKRSAPIPLDKIIPKSISTKKKLTSSEDNFSNFHYIVENLLPFIQSSRHLFSLLLVNKIIYSKVVSFASVIKYPTLNTATIKSFYRFIRLREISIHINEKFYKIYHWKHNIFNNLTKLNLEVTNVQQEYLCLLPKTLYELTIDPRYGYGYESPQLDFSEFVQLEKLKIKGYYDSGPVCVSVFPTNLKKLKMFYLTGPQLKLLPQCLIELKLNVLSSSASLNFMPRSLNKLFIGEINYSLDDIYRNPREYPSRRSDNRQASFINQFWINPPQKLSYIKSSDMMDIINETCEIPPSLIRILQGK